MADSRIDDLRRRLERDPGSRLFAQLAEEYRKAGNHADAIRIARAGLAQHPAYPSARLTLGRALLESGDLAGARAELETALRDAPDNILASRFLGQTLEALGELGPALEQLQKTLRLAPGDRQLETQIVSLQTRLRTPPPPPVEEPLAPTIRIRPHGEPGFWGRRAGGPPPLPPMAPPLATPPVVQAAAGAPAVAEPPPPQPGPPPAAPFAVTERLPAAVASAYETDVAPTLPTAQSPSFGLVDETALPTLPPGAVAAEEMVFEPEPPPLPEPVAEPEPVPEPVPEPAMAPSREAEAVPSEEPGPPGDAPFSSSTLAELYLKQGLVDRAADVYRQVLAEEPGNERARARLGEIQAGGAAPPDRAARRRALERTIAGLEALLALVVQRR